MRRPWLTFLTLAFLCLLPGAVQAATHKLLIVVLDKVSWPDLVAHQADAPTLWSVARPASVGAMCVRAAGHDDSGGAYLTLDAGSRAAADGSGRFPLGPEAYAFNATEMVTDRKAGVLYRTLTGDGPGKDAIVHLGVGDFAWQNLTPPYPLSIGLLGQRLREAGLHVACLGNADSIRGPHRNAAAIAMDRQGRVELGDVSADLLVADPKVPAGYRVATGRLAAAFTKLEPVADVVVLDLGETSRAAEFQATVPPKRADEMFAKALTRADRALAAVLNSAAPDLWGVLVVSPTLPPAYPGRPPATLAPIIWRIPGRGAGLLTSPSTRRSGFVTSADVAASILSYFELPTPPESVGRAFRMVPTDDSLDTLQHDLARHETIESVRRPMFIGFPTFATVVLGLALFGFLLGERIPRKLSAVLRGLLLLAMAMPSATLLVALWPDQIPSGTILAAVLGLTFVLALMMALVTRGRAADGMLALLLVAVLSLDLALGESMLRWSTLSYSVAAGARFYGLGNELAGGLMGATLVALAALLSGRTHLPVSLRLSITLLLVILTGLVASPGAGANFGMALACAVGFGVFTVYLWRGRFRWIDAAILAVVALGVGAAAVAVDMIAGRSGSASHIGMLVNTAQAEGPSAVFGAISRKLAMSWRLIGASTWSSVALVAMLILIGTVVFRPPMLVDALRRRLWLLPGLISVVVGSLAAIVLNDSGILAAAFALLYGAGSLAYVGLGKQSAIKQSTRIVTMSPKGTVRAE